MTPGLIAWGLAVAGLVAWSWFRRDPWIEDMREVQRRDAERRKEPP